MLDRTSYTAFNVPSGELSPGMVILELALSAAAHGTSITGLFWMLTVARGITGFGTGGEYPAEVER